MVILCPLQYILYTSCLYIITHFIVTPPPSIRTWHISYHDVNQNCLMLLVDLILKMPLSPLGFPLVDSNGIGACSLGWLINYQFKVEYINISYIRWNPGTYCNKSASSNFVRINLLKIVQIVSRFWKILVIYCKNNTFRNLKLIFKYD